MTFPSASAEADLYEDGHYRVVFPAIDSGSIGVFNIIYNGNSYTPDETVTILEGENFYDIDLYIETTGDTTPIPDDDTVPDDTTTNTPPVSDPAGPYSALMGTSIIFDGTKSKDTDGSITKYEWSFGDTTTATGAAPTHTYLEDGNYTVTLKVTDNTGASSQSSTYAFITVKPNNPPNKPILSGFKKWETNKGYELKIQATDQDDDDIQYIINWDDNTDTKTDFLPTNTTTTITHTYTSPGIYTVTAYTKDINSAESETSEHKILINIYYVNYYGYLIDNTNDGTYDTFYSNMTGNTSAIQQNNNLILIDLDEDKIYDHQYNINTGELNTYNPPQNNKKQTKEAIIPYSIMIPSVIFTIFIIIMILLIVFFKQKKPEQVIKPEEKTDKQIYYVHEPEKTETKDKTYDDITQKIDEIISKNEQKKK